MQYHELFAQTIIYDILKQWDLIIEGKHGNSQRSIEIVKNKANVIVSNLDKFDRLFFIDNGVSIYDIDDQYIMVEFDMSGDLPEIIVKAAQKYKDKHHNTFKAYIWDMVSNLDLGHSVAFPLEEIGTFVALLETYRVNRGIDLLTHVSVSEFIIKPT